MIRRRLALPLILGVLGAFLVSKPVMIVADMVRAAPAAETRSHDASQIVGLRFTDLNIPRGAQILSAYVEFADEHVTRTSSLTIRAQAVDDAPEIATAGATPGLRPLTSAGVVWSASARGSAPSAGRAQRTPNLAPMLQEIVGRPGWTPGNAIVLVFTRTGEGEAFDGGQGETPQLHVEFDPPSAHADRSTSGRRNSDGARPETT